MSQIQLLVGPVVAMLGLAFLLSAGVRNFYTAKYEQLAFGILFGCVIVIGMTNPLSLGDGLIFDTRTLLTGIAVAFVGPVAGAVAVTFGIVCRIIIGGAGMASGVVGLVLAYLLAVAWTKLSHGRIRKPIVKDGLLGAALTPSILALFVLPYDLAISLFVSILPTLLLCNIVGAIAIGFVFRREQRYFNEVEDHRANASTDGLTNLLNRRGMDEKVKKATFNPDTGHAVFYFDIDNFKYVNDTFGHDVGDATLAIVAARINEVIRSEAIFARQGGDEFSIYLPSLEALGAQAVGDRICRAISDQKFSRDDFTFDVSISLGGFWSKQDLDLKDMIQRADSQLLLAKRAGKNRAQIGYDRENGIAVVA